MRARLDARSTARVGEQSRRRWNVWALYRTPIMNTSLKDIESMIQINEIKSLYSAVLSESAEHNLKMVDIGEKQAYFLTQIALLEKIRYDFFHITLVIF
jgi:hypothetical protein